MLEGKIVTLFEDEEKTKPILPRTTLSAVTGKNGLNIQGELDKKQDTLTAGDNITIENNVISAKGGDLSKYRTSADQDTIDNAIKDRITTIENKESTWDSKADTSYVDTEVAKKQDTLVSGTNIKTLNSESLLGSGDIVLTKSSIGLGNVDNTSDANKPISTATQTALDKKQDTISDLATIRSGASKGATAIQSVKTINSTSLVGTGDITIDKSTLGLGNVDNTSDADKPISTATQTALDSKQSTLVSGTNIKTVNGDSLLGSGDLEISGLPEGGTEGQMLVKSSSTWVFYPTIVRASIDVDIKFNSNGQSCTNITCEEGDMPIETALYYNGNRIYYMLNWVDQAYRTVTFEEEPTGDLLAFLQKNATKVEATWTNQPIYVSDGVTASATINADLLQGHDSSYFQTQIDTKLDKASSDETSIYGVSGNDQILFPFSTFATDSELELKQDKLVSGSNIKTINSISLVGSGDINTTLSLDLLWTNASPTSTFDAQSISIDLTEYKLMYVVLNRSTTASTVLESFLLIKNSHQFPITEIGGNIASRSFLASDNNIIVGSAGVYVNGVSSTNNNNMIPLYVYGIKWG